MKVSTCSTASLPNNPVGITYEEMVSKEGVYKCVGSSSGSRLIVLKSKDSSSVLYSGCGVLESAGARFRDYRFIKVEGATICFEIKE